MLLPLVSKQIQTPCQKHKNFALNFHWWGCLESGGPVSRAGCQVLLTASQCRLQRDARPRPGAFARGHKMAEPWCPWLQLLVLTLVHPAGLYLQRPSSVLYHHFMSGKEDLRCRRGKAQCYFLQDKTGARKHKITGCHSGVKGQGLTMIRLVKGIPSL